MRRALQGHFLNGLCGVLDYAAWPIGMLLVAPAVLRTLGAAHYGVFAVAIAVVSTGSIIASGFGDANIQNVAAQRGAGRSQGLLLSVRNTMGLHIVLGLAMALLTWVLAPLIASHVVRADALLRRDCLLSIRLASFIIFFRAIETVCISTQRAFERYGPAVAISIAGRMLSLILACALAWLGRPVADIMAASLVITAFSVWMQERALRALLDTGPLRPAFDRDALSQVFHFGIFSWLLAVASVVIGQIDRLIAGVALGAVAVAAYALCVQIAQPLYGIVSSGLHFLFPHLAARCQKASHQELRRIVLRAVLANLAVVATGTLALLIFGNPLLCVLAGPAIAHAARPVLPLIIWSSALLSLTVTACYALMAFDRIRIVASIHLTAGAAMLGTMAWLNHTHGIDGIALARFAYGAVALFLYLPLLRFLYPNRTPRLRPVLRTRSRKGPDPTHANVLGIRIETLNMSRALQRVASVLRRGQKAYVSVIGVHGIMEAQRNPRLAAIYAQSAITIPDGMPTVWVGRLQGSRQMERVAGPDLMLEILRDRRFAHYTHFLYGGDPDVALALSANLTRWFPWARIVGTFTPPYRDLSHDEEDDLIATVDRCKPDFIWVGISTPRQEEFMHRYLPLLDTRIMFGVGAAFDYHTGRIRDCSVWIKKAGLQWLHRLVQNPRRLWRRYLRNIPAFLWNIALQFTGLRSFEPAATESVSPQPLRHYSTPLSSDSPVELSRRRLVSRR